MDVTKVKGASVQYPKPPELKPSYGTAGFRSNATLLPCTVFRWPSHLALQTGSHCRGGPMLGPKFTPWLDAEA